MVYVGYKDTKYIFLFSLKVPSIHMMYYITECPSYHRICLAYESQQRTSGLLSGTTPCIKEERDVSV